MATRDRYIVSGDSPEAIERTVNAAMRSISDRLDAQEGIRGFPFIPQDTIRFPTGDTRPSVENEHLFITKNVKATVITHLMNGYAGQRVDVIIGDDFTTVDFNTGNLRTNSGQDWPATQEQYMHAVYDAVSEKWHCSAWDGDIAIDYYITTSDTPGVGTRWQFVEFSDNRTLELTDAFKMMKSTSGSAQTATVPPVADVAWQSGDQISFFQYGAGALTIAAGSGVTINTPSTLVVNEQYGTVVIVMHDDDEWFIAGRMAAV